MCKVDEGVFLGLQNKEKGMHISAVKIIFLFFNSDLFFVFSRLDISRLTFEYFENVCTSWWLRDISVLCLHAEKGGQQLFECSKEKRIIKWPLSAVYTSFSGSLP